jgi:hypothetical protein
MGKQAPTLQGYAESYTGGIGENRAVEDAEARNTPGLTLCRAIGSIGPTKSTWSSSSVRVGMCNF